MKLVTYVNTRAPVGIKVLVLIYFDGRVLPVQFRGDDRERLEAKAQAWIDDELEKVRKKETSKGQQPAGLAAYNARRRAEG